MSDTNPTGKRPPGRPKLEDGLARSKVISVRLTEYGYQRMQALANLSQRSVADYTREVLKQLVTGQILARIPPPDEA